MVVEDKIEGRELTCGVLGERYLPAVEIIPDNFNSAKQIHALIVRLREES